MIAAILSFVGGLIGAGMGAFFSGRTERLKLLRSERLSACAELMAACRSAVVSWDHYRRYEAIKDGRFEVEDPEVARRLTPEKLLEHAEKVNQAKAEAWNAYHRLRMLGPKDFVEALELYWADYRLLLASELNPQTWSLDFERLKALEENLYAASSKYLTK